METQNTSDSSYSSRRERFKDKQFGGPNTSSRVWAGILIITVGVIFFARQAGAYIPHFITSWPMILIAVGSFLALKHSFRGPAWAILLVVGSIFLIREIDPMLDFGHYVWPLIIIVVGIMLIVRPQKKNVSEKPLLEWSNTDPNAEVKASLASNPPSSEDYLDSVTIFGGIKKNIFSKTFRGGEMVTIFGGTEINLTQADVQHPIVLDITQIFGGAKLIVPPHWRIQSEDTVSIFGSVEDKRPVLPENNYDSGKVLILKGTNIFGGIDIKSY